MIISNRRFHKLTDKDFAEFCFTKAALSEELYLQLYGLQIKILNPNSGEEILVRKYEEQARYLMYRIPIYRPMPDFIINISDIPRLIKNALDELDDFALNDVIKDGISRFFLNINERYFRLNVKKLLRWRLEC
jgi:hypothetical protein